MLVLGIESSCDETAAAVVEVESKKVLSSVIASQNRFHEKFGGVVPEVASREHLKSVLPVIHEALDKGGIPLEQLGGLAVTYGPGLAGSLLVGLGVAKALALSTGKPWVGVNHLEGHLLAGFLEHPGMEFPFLGLVVSGGHTSLFAMESFDRHRLLASTRDDAAGEAYDKVAKLLGLGYPGGPALDKVARAYAGKPVPFPKALMKDGSLDFSFSGLKTAVLVYLEEQKAAGREADVAAVAAGFQIAVTEVLIKKMLKAVEQLDYRNLVLGGGVAANSRLRSELKARAETLGCSVFIPSTGLCMDNGAMIAYAGGLRLMRGERTGWDLGVSPNLKY